MIIFYILALIPGILALSWFIGAIKCDGYTHNYSTKQLINWGLEIILKFLVIVAVFISFVWGIFGILYIIGA